jgi:hypothetical protein
VSDDEAQVRSLIEWWVQAAYAGDLDAVLGPISSGGQQGRPLRRTVAVSMIPS